MLKFREDDGLSVLALASHKDLERLARILTHDESDGKERHAQQLLSDASYMAAVEEGDLRPAWKAIAAELQAYGGDTIANKARSLTKDYSGVTYREVITDIREHLSLQFNPDNDIRILEDQLLVGLILGYMDEFRFEDLMRIMEVFAQGKGVDTVLQENMKYRELVKRIMASLGAVPSVLKKVALSSGGLLGGAVKGVTSPAFRVTVPAVLEVIRIRRVVLQSPMNEGCGA